MDSACSLKAEPSLNFPPELLLRAQGVKVAFFDIDGVMTDGGLYFSEYPAGHEHASTTGGFRSSGEIIKRFNTLDGQGIKLLQKAGITPVVITGRDSSVLRGRLKALGISHCYFGCEDKRPAAEQTLRTLGLNWDAAAAMGDDWPDLPVMLASALSCAPANAHLEVRSRAHHITAAQGGHGAAREFCDLLLVAGGHYAAMLREYLA